MRETYEALGGEVDRVQPADLGVEAARGGDEGLDRTDHLVRSLRHGPDDAEEGNEDRGEEGAEELHRGGED